MQISADSLFQQFGPSEISDMITALQKLDSTPLGKTLIQAFQQERMMLYQQTASNVASERYTDAQKSVGGLEQLDQVCSLEGGLFPGIEEACKQALEKCKG